MRGWIAPFVTLSFVVIVLFSGFLAAPSEGKNASVQTVSSSGVLLRPFRLGLFMYSFNFDGYDLSSVGSTFDVCRCKWADYDYSYRMVQLKNANPDIKILFYRNVFDVYSYWPDEWDLAKDEGWLLKDIDGNYVIDTRYGDENYRIDITNHAYQDWVSDKINSWLHSYPLVDGVLVDNGLKYKVEEWEQYDSGRPINPITGTYFTWTEIQTAYIELLNKIVDTLGPSKIVIPNGIWNGRVFYAKPDTYTTIISQVPGLNGIFSEGTFRESTGDWLSEDDWQDSINFVTWVQDNFLAGHTDRYFVAQCTSSPAPSGADPQQVMLYSFCSMLLSVKYSSPQNSINFNVIYTQNTDLLLFVQKLRNVELYQPIDDYYKISATSVYAREYAGGKVLVNPTSTASTVQLEGSYTTIFNESVSGPIIIPPHSGIILLK
jgi:hypothetical protein